MAEKTSLEKSHSKASNFKLTMICFLAAFAVSVLWVGLGLIPRMQTIGIILAAGGGVVTILSLFLVGKFTR